MGQHPTTTLTTWLPPALSSEPTELCLVIPGFVPNTIVTEIIIDEEGNFAVPCMDRIFADEMVAQEVVDYEYGSCNGCVVVYHDFSVPLSRAGEKTFLLVPVTRIRDCQRLDDEVTEYFAEKNPRAKADVQT